jgi:hypothetical protein
MVSFAKLLRIMQGIEKKYKKHRVGKVSVAYFDFETEFLRPNFKKILLHLLLINYQNFH